MTIEKLKLDIEKNYHYLQILKSGYSIFQPEIREAIDFALLLTYNKACQIGIKESILYGIYKEKRR